MKKKQQKRVKNSPRVAGRRVVNALVEAFACRLKEWRQAEGATLKTVAAGIDVSVAVVCEWEHGNRFPSVDHLLAIAQHTGIPAGVLITPVKGAGMRKAGRRRE